MRILVMGTGGVGGYFGGRLAHAGEDVVFVARGAHLSAINTQGLVLESPDGAETIIQAHAVEDPSPLSPPDVVLVGVKAWQVREAGELIRPLVGPHTMVVPLQNGVESAGVLASILGPAPVIGGLCYIVAYIDGPGRIKHAGLDPFIAFGEPDGRESPRVRKLFEAFQNAGVRVDVSSDINAAVWEKFMFIAAFSGVAAATRAPAGVLRAVPETRVLLMQAIEEIGRVARARGVKIHEEAERSVMAKIDALPPESTASMQRDIMAIRPSELDSQSGAVVRLGAEVGEPTPAHAMLYAALAPMELRARGRIHFFD